MDSDQKFWLGFWAIIGTVFFSGFLMLTLTMNAAGQRHAQRSQACIEQGGSWVDQRNYDGVCVAGKK